MAFPWGSESINRTRRSLAAREAARLMAVVVLPTPPFWFAIAMTLATGCFTWNDSIAMFHVERFHNTQSLRSPQGNRTGSAHAMRESLLDSQENRLHPASGRHSEPNEGIGQQRLPGIDRSSDHPIATLRTNLSIRSARTETFFRLSGWTLAERRPSSDWIPPTSHRQSGLRIAMGIPGKPAPEPRSSTECFHLAGNMSREE